MQRRQPPAGTAEPRARRVTRQREAGEATRRETRRLLLAAAGAEFAERGYAAATPTGAASGTCCAPSRKAPSPATTRFCQPPGSPPPS